MYYSLTRGGILGSHEFVGAQNYIKAATHPIFLKTLQNTHALCRADDPDRDCAGADRGADHSTTALYAGLFPQHSLLSP